MSTYVDYAELTQNLDALIDSYNGSIKDISAPMFHLDYDLDGTAKIMFKDLTDIDGSSFSENQINRLSLLILVRVLTLSRKPVMPLVVGTKPTHL